MKDILKKLKDLGYELPALPPAGGIYKPVRQVGNLLYVYGQGATINGVPAIVGKVGAECSLDQGREAARLCTLNALSTLNNYLGSLEEIKSVVKILGFVASAKDFNLQPKVIDGCSALLRDLFGEDGVGARSAIGVSELPGNIACEIEFIFEI